MEASTVGSATKTDRDLARPLFPRIEAYNRLYCCTVVGSVFKGNGSQNGLEFTSNLDTVESVSTAIDLNSGRAALPVTSS